MSTLNLGCGTDIRRGPEQWINLDRIKLPGVDVVHDIEQRLPFNDSVFDVVFASHVIEHVGFDKKIFIIEEMWRVTRAGGIIEIQVPNWSHKNAYTDPTHKSLWELDTFDYFVPGHKYGYVSKVRFDVLKKEVRGEEKQEIYWKLKVLK